MDDWGACNDRGGLTLWQQHRTVVCASLVRAGGGRAPVEVSAIVRVNVCVFVCMYAQMFACAHSKSACVRECVCVCASVHMCVCKCVL